ncbi:hypothetical protein SUGI_1168630 [Cryptomeria japonica]|nr:hypothetical protein SUGI_1168630 [Cryptomeria japonica]
MSRGFFIVVFAIEEEHQKISEGGLWLMDKKPLYIQKWYRNFYPLMTETYDKPIWIRLNNLLMEYWIEEALEKVQSIEIEEDKNFYLIYGKSNHDTVKCKIPKKEKKIWREKQKIENNPPEEPLRIDYVECLDGIQVTHQNLEKPMDQAKDTSMKVNEELVHKESEFPIDSGSEDGGFLEYEEEKDELGIIDTRNIS